MTVHRLTLVTDRIELDRSVLKSGQLIDRMSRSGMALGVLNAELFDAAHQSGLLPTLKPFSWLVFHFVLSDREQVLAPRCLSVAEDKMYLAVVSVDGRTFLDAPVEELYWRKYRAGLGCLAFISQHLGASPAATTSLVQLHSSTPQAPPFPQIPSESREKQARYHAAAFASSGRKSGQLVVTIIKNGTFQPDHSYEELFQQLKDALMLENLGVWAGDSQDQSAAEIEFSCKDTARASAIVRGLLDESSTNYRLDVLAD